MALEGLGFISGLGFRVLGFTHYKEYAIGFVAV